jgi:hypothetical protein
LSVPSSGIVVTNGNSDGLKSTVTTDPIATQGFSVPSAASGPRGRGGEVPGARRANPGADRDVPPAAEAARRVDPAFVRVTVLHPATSITRTEAIEPNSVRIG